MESVPPRGQFEVLGGHVMHLQRVVEHFAICGHDRGVVLGMSEERWRCFGRDLLFVGIEFDQFGSGIFPEQIVS